MRIEPDLYGGGPDTAIQVAAEAQDLPRLMLVGHQPTWSLLVSMLTDRIVEMKTATVAVIALDVDTWSELPGVTGEIETVYQPRDFLGTALDFDPG
jgi:phosphohistidine phosphatase SixA